VLRTKFLGIMHLTNNNICGNVSAMNDAKALTLIKIIDQFPTDDAARQHLEGIRWKDGIVCPQCGCNDQTKFSTIAANPAKKVRAGLRWCSACRKQFTVTVGTIFEDSHIPLRKWLIAWYLICSSEKGISSLQLQRLLELGSYRSALFMAHRIRYALQDPVFNTPMNGTVEVDETYVGGKPPVRAQGRTRPGVARRKRPSLHWWNAVAGCILKLCAPSNPRTSKPS